MSLAHCVEISNNRLHCFCQRNLVCVDSVHDHAKNKAWAVNRAVKRFQNKAYPEQLLHWRAFPGGNLHEWSTMYLLGWGVISSCCCRILSFIKSKLFIKCRQGAQTTLYCCLAEGVQGLTYYNNCLGVVPTSKISYDNKRAAAMWDLSNKLTQHFR